ncbi:MAG: UMP kinase [Saprospiraceae bacterium]|nr:UMP kinase [Saprospiraceae bacterium]MBK8448674.1 UMP kinase [Saprospiraceae bacterium]MBK8482825.1 UMP kinase [Saprospiraceae bacterium]MBK9722813.1 UMP kinase [Saprospiraceae bacterium]MBK9726717.1 UMP kinase [Saprospiraceae bacterium]
MSKYKRILLKLSGEALMGEQKYGIEPSMLKYYAQQIKMAVSHKIELAVVIGGGNIFRGMDGEGSGIERAQGDYMGMLATCINGMALQSALETLGVYTRLISAIEMRQIAEPYIRRRAIRHLEKGRVLIFSAGTGNPYFTTDSAAALRASEINAEVILKATRVDGIYDKDPLKHKDAVRFDQLSFTEVISRGLQVMDMTAFTMCKENQMPIIVFDVNQESNFERIIKGERIGTLVS